MPTPEEGAIGTSLVSYLVAAAVFTIIVLVGWAVSGFIRRLAARAPGAAPGLIANSVGSDVVGLFGVIGLRVAVSGVELPGAAADLVASACKFVTIVLMTRMVTAAYRTVHEQVLMPRGAAPDSRLDQHFYTLVYTVIRPVMWVAGVAMALNSVGFDVSAILAGMGIGGMALALASQDTVANVFGGLLVLTERPFKRGDRIEIAGMDGWVQNINLRNTVIMNWYGRLVTIPNKKFTDEVVVNVDAQSCYFEEAVVRLDPEHGADDVELAMKIIREILDEVDFLEKNPWVSLRALSHGFHEIEVWYGVMLWKEAEAERFANHYTKITAAHTLVNVAILRRFAQAGLSMAVPIYADYERPVAASRRGRPPVMVGMK